MRGTVAKLCHGGPRKPREPYGVVAPFLRAAGWSAVFLGAGSVVVLVVTSHLAPRATGPIAVVAVVGCAMGVGLRYLAGSFRPAEVDLTAVETEPPR